MNDKATFEEHIDKVCAQVNHKAGWILRTFHCRNTWFMQLMWKQLIQGNIDYTKKIPEVRKLIYWERLEHLKIISQQKRLERYRIIYTWKDLEGLAPNCGINTRGDI